MQWWGEHSKHRIYKVSFKNFPLAIILMIAILILLFQDYRKPVIILLVSAILLGWCLECYFQERSLALLPLWEYWDDRDDDKERCGADGGDWRQHLRAKTDGGAARQLVSRFRPVMMASLTTILA